MSLIQLWPRGQNSLSRARQKYFEEGDKAGRLLARYIKQKEAMNTIPAIRRDNGCVLTDPKGINAFFWDFYVKRYTSESKEDRKNITSCLQESLHPAPPIDHQWCCCEESEQHQGCGRAPHWGPLLEQQHLFTGQKSWAAPLLPPQTEKSQSTSPHHAHLLLWNHREHPDQLHHCVVWQLLCILPEDPAAHSKNSWEDHHCPPSLPSHPSRTFTAHAWPAKHSALHVTPPNPPTVSSTSCPQRGEWGPSGPEPADWKTASSIRPSGCWTPFQLSPTFFPCPLPP